MKLKKITLWDETTYYFSKIICQISRSHRPKNLQKRVKFGVSIHCLDNASKEWPEIWHSDVSWPHSEQCSRLSWKSCRSCSEFWEIQTLICKEMCKKLLVLTKSCQSRTDGPALVPNTDSELIRFWSQSVDFLFFCRICSMAPCLSNWPLAAEGPFDKSVLVQGRAWCHTGNKPFLEPMKAWFTDIHINHHASVS